MESKTVTIYILYDVTDSHRHINSTFSESKVFSMKKYSENSSPVNSPPLGDNTTNRRYHSQVLFCGQQEILIEHAGHSYRLRITRQDKLILTK